MLGLKILQKIFIYIIIALGTLIILSIISGSGFLYFKNDWVISNINSLNNNFQSLLTNVETNINKTVDEITKLVGTSGTEGEIQKNLTSIITELQNLQTAHQGVNLTAQIQQLQNFKNNVINGDLNNLVSNVQTATNNALVEIKNINSNYINPTVAWLSSNSKKVALITFIASTSILSLSIILTIVVKIIQSKAKRAEAK